MRSSEALSTVFFRALACAALIVATGCGRSHEAHVLRFADGIGEYQLNPYFAGEQQSADIAELTMASLIRWGDQSNQFVPELLSELPTRANGGISADYRHLTLHLRPGLRWSDGAPLTARDVVFTHDTITDPQGGAPFADGWAELSSIKAVDATTIVMVTRDADADFPRRYLYSSMRYILPGHVIGKTPISRSAYNRLPIGAGPFRYTKLVSGLELVLEPNPYYFRGRPKLARIEVRSVPDPNTQLVQMKSNELDMLANLAAENYAVARELPNTQLASLSTYATLRLLFNTRSPIASDRAVREAVRLAIDRATIGKKVYHGAGETFEAALIPEDAMQAKLPLTPFDAARASAVLEHAGWHLGADGIRSKGPQRLSLDIIAPSADPRIDAVIEVMRLGWARAGIAMQVQRLPYQEMLAPDSKLMNGKFDATIVTSGTASFLFDNEYACANIPPHGYDLTRFCNAQVEQDLRVLRRTDEPATRKRLFIEMQQIVDREVPIIILVQPPNLYVIGSQVSGLHLNPWSFFERFMDVDVQ